MYKYFEFNVGDSFIHQLPHALEKKGPVGDTGGKSYVTKEAQHDIFVGTAVRVFNSECLYICHFWMI